MKKTESLLRWVSIVLFAILAIFVTIPVLSMVQNAALRRMNPFALEVLVAVLLWFIVVRFLFQDFYVRGQLFGRVRDFYNAVLEHPLHTVYRLAFRGMSFLSSRLLFLGALILILTGILASTPALDGISTKMMSLPQLRGVSQPAPESHARILWITPGDYSTLHYLKTCLRLAQDLKAAGARVVTFDLPALPATEQYLKLIASIEETGIAVFGNHATEPYYDSRVIFSPVSNKMKLTWGHYSLFHNPHPYKPFHFVDKFFPNEFRDLKSHEIVPDIAMVVIRQYLGGGPIERNHRNLSVGNLILPVSRDGALYSLRSWRPKRMPLIVLRAGEASPIQLEYRFLNASEKSWEEPTSTNLKGYEELFKNKIVLTKFLDRARLTDQPQIESYLYANLIDNILDGKFVLREAEGWPAIVTIFAILVCVLLCRVLRGVFAVPLMFLFAVALAFGGLWLLNSNDTLLDFSYPLAAIILCIAILPLARFSYMMRTMEDDSLARMVPTTSA